MKIGDDEGSGRMNMIVVTGYEGLYFGSSFCL
jgi:hypothetical protein